MRATPVFREGAWSAVAAHLVIMFVPALILQQTTELRLHQSVFIVAALLIVYRLFARAVFARDHVAGIRSIRAGDLDGAIANFERSSRYFAKHRWLDRWRFVLLLASSSTTYREMAPATSHSVTARPAAAMRRGRAMDMCWRSIRTTELPGRD